MEWKLKPFGELTKIELYRILQLRSAVFVVEQKCVYQDLDGYDFEKEAAFGRIIVDPAERKGGIGRDLVSKSLEILIREWEEKRIKIQAQVYVKHFYGSYGFKEITEEYLEDGIPHVDMFLTVE
ncbi:GNAT family N-acetyltransferase [Paenibacillus larvae]|uniref:Acetyltransferase-like protein n=3 Tax=Paenibacillus larvae TaxID=1464 RepID=V9WAN5_9BACL|nr:GNAT family N-acetyltransferase [Paenibacillus larvae]AHD06192.1 acetyltransferase-like protein [Paenibacillus larvae subsp. larvae DSM 25430]AQR77277.1 hypothetical protein BXP28_07810 [Paenibacillus larvae subsp. larvae]AVF21743.1 acetyltransferase-like protein [Paenibacillus larvae subsp. larvae]AVG12728.1 acetyltransferase-like protein [Paenibacillus larvae subsp. larvae DSM 25430]ETK27563.1 acetyltransferase-like protein [Paenibacillus larvae subsp. larvae DSM 25719]